MDYSTLMPALNIREFPSLLLQKLKIRAAMDGTTVKDLVIRTLEQEVKDVLTTGSKKPRKQ